MRIEFKFLLTRILSVHPMCRQFRGWYLPGDIANELLIDRIVCEAISEIHCNLGAFRGNRQFGSHASVSEGLLGACIVLHYIPRPEELQENVRALYYCMRKRVFTVNPPTYPRLVHSFCCSRCNVNRNA